MKMKALILSLSFLSFGLSAKLEIRNASHSPIEGYTESSYTSRDKERRIYLDSEIIVSSADVADAFSSKSGDTYSVYVEFTDEGAEKLKRITEKRIRKPLAMIVDGKVLSAPTVMEALSKNVQTTGFTESEAKKLAESILNHNKSE